MKQLTLGLAAFLCTAGAFAYDTSDATRQVMRYTDHVACTQTSMDNQPLQYKAVQIADGFESKDGYGAAWAVFWSGQYGCPGGNSSDNYVTLVEMRGWVSSPVPVVTDRENWPNLTMAWVEDFYVDKGVLVVKGITHNDGDANSNPTKPIVQRFKYDRGAIDEIK